MSDTSKDTESLSPEAEVEKLIRDIRYADSQGADDILMPKVLKLCDAYEGLREQLEPGAWSLEPGGILEAVLFKGTRLVPHEERYFSTLGMAEALGYKHDLKRFYSEPQLVVVIGIPVFICWIFQ